MPRTISIAACALLIALGTAPCMAQQPGSGAGSPKQKMQPGDLVRRAKDPAPTKRMATPVLSEGTFLASVQGYFAPSLREPGLLTFRIDERQVSSVRRTLYVMPCDPTDDVKAILNDPRPDQPSLFEVTGSIYECHGRAYLLPVSVIPMRSPPPPGMLARIAPRELQPARARREGRAAPRIDAYTDADATDLDQSLARDVPADRQAHEPNPANFPGLDDGLANELERKLDAGILASGLGTAMKRAATKYDRHLLLPPATRVQERRATVLRDPVTGVWRARIDTARAGEGSADGAELSMELLPTRALEHLERAVRSRPIGTTWLLSGEVVVAKDRNYLLLGRSVESPMHRFETP
jgi:hypothetical protein